MPSCDDLLSYAELVESGRVQARAEWRRAGQVLARCRRAEEAARAPGEPLPLPERSCLFYGYNSELHALNAAQECAPAPVLLALPTASERAS